MSDIQLYDEFAVKHEAAFAAFSRIHEAKNPRPVKSTIQRDMVSAIVVLALTIVMLASVIVSSSRTIGEFGGGFIGTMAFVMTEGGIMAYAFFRARRTASKERLQNTVKWAVVGLILTFIVGLGANIDAALKTKGIVLPRAVNVIINLLVAISAPALAFISSDVLAIELMATDIKRREADATYAQDCKDWQDTLNKSWAAAQNKWGVRIEVPTVSNGIPLENIGILPAKSTLGHTKKRDAARIVMQHFADNPDAIQQDPMEIAAYLQVGKSTVYNVLKSIKSKPVDADSPQ